MRVRALDCPARLVDATLTSGEEGDERTSMGWRRDPGRAPLPLASGVVGRATTAPMSWTSGLSSLARRTRSRVLRRRPSASRPGISIMRCRKAAAPSPLPPARVRSNMADGGPSIMPTTNNTQFGNSFETKKCTYQDESNGPARRAASVPAG
jgi:hypothetical protein